MNVFVNKLEKGFKAVKRNLKKKIIIVKTSSSLKVKNVKAGEVGRWTENTNLLGNYPLARMILTLTLIVDKIGII